MRNWEGFLKYISFSVIFCSLIIIYTSLFARLNPVYPAGVGVLLYSAVRILQSTLSKDWLLVFLCCIYVIVGVFIISNPAVGIATAGFVVGIMLLCESIINTRYYLNKRRIGSFLLEGLTRGMLSLVVFYYWPIVPVIIVSIVMSTALMVMGVSCLVRIFLRGKA